MKLPFIPGNAPYSDTQRAWLSGFFAGMHSHMLQSASSIEPANARPLFILYGTQTGNSESLAHDAANRAKAHGLVPVVKSMDEVEVDQLVKMDHLLIITSTYGEGAMPDNAEMLWDAVKSASDLQLGNIKYSVLALGDTSYDLFCQAGIDWDNQLAALGAQRIFDRVDCDVDFEEPTAEKSSKETRHYEISIAGSGLNYEAGDALCVVPSNGAELVAAIIKALACNGDEMEPVNGESLSLKTALTDYFEIKLPSKEFIEEIAKRSGDQELNAILASGDKEQLSNYLWGRDILDLLLQFPQVEFSGAEFIALLKPLQHRAYSISSSGKAHPDTVHLTVASVRYDAHGRHHKGVCSTYLADMVDESTDVRVFFTPNNSFRVPQDDSLPMIMVGPGTGIAPFRAFLQEREFRQAQGKNWLFFGDRNASTDFIYRDEIEALQASGLLTRLDLAFSDKRYVRDVY
ncbi:MAG: sulfite reductase flavoprotein subunit alpha [Methylococcaceae bacterium]|nr:sulfite reductase flavoprotein subunit alpha [Methylococcaceae bacterium]